MICFPLLMPHLPPGPSLHPILLSLLNSLRLVPSLSSCFYRARLFHHMEPLLDLSSWSGIGVGDKGRDEAGSLSVALSFYIRDIMWLTSQGSFSL